MKSLLSAPKEAQKTYKRLRHPVWTESKAKLIQRYLRLFVYVTKHGTYIDAFAGPQEPTKHEMWSAKLVLDNKPRWLRHFHFFEQDPEKVTALQQLTLNQPPKEKGEPTRTYKIWPGDFNTNLPKMFSEYPIKDTEATFCLLDQRTFECDWQSVKTVAEHKKNGNKIELFYFFPHGWINRSHSRLNDQDETFVRWWGDSDCKELLELRGIPRGLFVAERFKARLGYKDVSAFPIYEKKGGGRIMYFMIHASDHPLACTLMHSAYNNTVGELKLLEQMLFKSL
jgi:three-Cys-motif partner protein